MDGLTLSDLGQYLRAVGTSLSRTSKGILKGIPDLNAILMHILLYKTHVPSERLGRVAPALTDPLTRIVETTWAGRYACSTVLQGGM